MSVVITVFEFIREIVNRCSLAIEEYEKFAELNGEQKKARLDEVAFTYYDANFDKLKLPILIKGWIKKNLRKLIPTLTQTIYNLLRKYIQGVTKTA